MSKPRKAARPSRRERELRALIAAEFAMRELLTSYASPTQGYAFLREPLAQLNAERMTIEMADAGDKTAQRMRRVRRTA